MDISTPKSPFPTSGLCVVGVGTSAGGLEALESFFVHMPSDSGLAFVVIQHLSPDFKSLMEELLSRRTEIAIRRAEDKMAVEPNAIYIMPPKNEMIISGGRLLLIDKDPGAAFSLPIDTFFRSLAQDLGERAVGIILTGTGSDGSRGIRAIHEAGGLVIVQSEETAKFDGMPRSAIETGIVDLVLLPGAMAEALLDFVEHPMPTTSERPKRLAAPKVERDTNVSVVIVEDNSDSREMLLTLLKLDGYDVTAAADGIEGFQAIAERRPDVALVDIGLPGMDGYEVARKVRAELEGVPIRLVALTGYGRPKDRQQVLAAGFNEHLVKPVDPSELIRVLSKPY